jgi:hypothetical protein
MLAGSIDAKDRPLRASTATHEVDRLASVYSHLADIG